MRDPSVQPLAYVGDALACLRGGRIVFADLSFRLEAGGALLLTGPNGSGKSSLLRLMAGLIRPFAGRLAWVEGTAPAEPPPIAYVGHADAVKPALSTLENVTFWAALAAPDGADARARAALEAVGLDFAADIPARHLSAGQRRRLTLARLHAAPARLWLLDEPTIGLDRASVHRLEADLARHRAAGGMVALATHTPVALPGAAPLDLGEVSADPLPAEAGW